MRARAQAAKLLLPGAYAEEIRMMAERRRAFADWFRPYDAIVMPTMAIPAIPLSEVDETSPIPGYREVPLEGKVIYVSDDGKYLIQGTLFDIAARESLTGLSEAVIRKGFASTSIEELVEAQPDSAQAQFWLGNAYGNRIGQVGMFSKMLLA